METLQKLSTQFGTGNLVLDATIVAVVFALMILVAAFITWGIAHKPQESTARGDRFDMMLGRLERTERTLHEFRSDVLRSLELSRTELEYLRNEVEVVRSLLAQESATFGVNERRPSREELAIKLKGLPGFVPAFPESTFAESGSGESGLGESGWDKKINEFSPRVAPNGDTVSADDEESGSNLSDRSSSAPKGTSLSTRLEKTRKGFFDRFKGVFSLRPKVDAEAIDELEAILVGSDLGVRNIREILGEVRKDLADGVELSEGGVKAIVKSKLLALLERGSPTSEIPTPKFTDEGPVVILVVGVNGAGKTTSAAKLAGRFKADGAECLLVAADTFRAAAVEQLHEWGRRIGVPVVSGADNAKPQTVVFAAMERATAEHTDCVIIDTAGRLHTKQSLMDELTGIRNAIEKHVQGAPHEVLLVLDGSTGQNALNQAREFNSSTGITGLVVTKLDGTSKGGIVVAIKDELGIPVRYIGTGESIEDLSPFSAREFVEAIFSA